MEKLKKIFKKENKTKESQIYEQFLSEILEGCQKLYRLLNNLIEGNPDKSELEGVILSEKRCDRLKEKYINLLFKNKRSLPFLVEDRYHIITNLDHVINKAELVARYLEVYQFKLKDNIIDNVKKLNDLFKITVEKLIKCTRQMENDFNSAYDLTFQIEKTRREAYDLQFDILIIIYKNDENAIYSNLTSKIISYLYEVISHSEQLSDYFRGLIIKYPSK